MSPAFLPDLKREASVRASIMVSNSKFSHDDWEDLRQEMIVDCLRRAKWFDCSRGEWKQFVRRVMLNRSMDLFTQRNRRAQREFPGGDIADHRTDEALETLWAAPVSRAIEGLDLRVDVQRVLAGLPTAFQQLALQLSSMKVVEICAKTGQPRARIYRMIRRLRREFEDAGLSPLRHGAGYATSRKRGTDQ